jgi:hypothetical protein
MDQATPPSALASSSRSPLGLVERGVQTLIAAAGSGRQRGAWHKIILAVLACSPIACAAQAQLQQPDLWDTYVDERYGTRVEYPSRFSVSEGEPAQGSGKRLVTPDQRAEIQIYSLPNTAHYTPRSYLAAKMRLDSAQLNYERVTPRFFAISADDEDRIYYTRCNFSEAGGGAIHCISLGYPRSEKREWDPIVTRISLSLRP